MNPVTSTASRPGHGPGHALSRSRAASRGLPGSVVIRRMFTALLLMAAALLIVPAVQAASSGGSADKPVVEQLLNAIAQNDYQRFISQGTPAFASVGEANFQQVADVVSPRLKQGYTVQHLGNLRQQGLDISVWKISFADNGDDLLATLNVTQGRVGGFFLR